MKVPFKQLHGCPMKKAGRFIAQCRKEKNMTQHLLAEEIGISDKAISKWETGRGLPEAAYMVSLCDALGINVNELLTGERIPEEEYQSFPITLIHLWDGRFRMGF